MAGHGAHSHRKIGGNRPGVSPQGAKTCFVINVTWPFGHLSCTDFDHFWNKRESLSACVGLHRWKIFPILHRVFQVPKQPQNTVLYGRMLVIELQLKQHNCGRWWSFRGVVDIRWMCLLYVSFGGDVRFGRYKPTKESKFLRLHYLSWPNRITVSVNSNLNRLLLGTLL